MLYLVFRAKRKYHFNNFYWVDCTLTYSYVTNVNYMLESLILHMLGDWCMNSQSPHIYTAFHFLHHHTHVSFASRSLTLGLVCNIKEILPPRSEKRVLCRRFDSCSPKPGVAARTRNRGRKYLCGFFAAPSSRCFWETILLKSDNN